MTSSSSAAWLRTVPSPIPSGTQDAVTMFRAAFAHSWAGRWNEGITQWKGNTKYHLFVDAIWGSRHTVGEQFAPAADAEVSVNGFYIAVYGVVT